MNEWNLKKIQNYIDNKIEENLNLDYKASGSLQRNDKKTNEISKDISALANSDGGIIIYGIKEDPIKKHLPESIDPINRDIISKEWLEQIIQGKISPRISGIKINPIEVNNNNEVIYVVEVPKSDTAHQASDRKYYKRFNFNSEPMYDYEIRDVFNRNKFPKIELEFKIFASKYEIAKSRVHHGFPFDTLKDQHTSKEYKTIYRLTIHAKNVGKILAKYVNAHIFFNDKFLAENNNLDIDSHVKYSCDNTVRDIVDVQLQGLNPVKKYGPSRYDPILPKLAFKIKTLKLNDSFKNSDYVIKWVVFADNAEPITGSIKLSEIEIKEE
ncbi:ATP-binding protein [Elizabethkingia anophelis]|uniref:AlbA family DNA-binding domain-containing protein n=1 Tax=Elizabethkingia anophelis TaxID=1117645 RepID=UPI0020B455B7|nr:ATP-binding protein [Elizabethkingia anophelis]UTF99034.1 ATP-binding protein [Elizabethkingia anophelis]UTG63792.1 ATP-binding protein [Elizabethkingia anophelis]